MLNSEEKEELDGLRAFVNASDKFTRRLVELERKDAPSLCPVCKIEHNTEKALEDGTLPGPDLATAPSRTWVRFKRQGRDLTAKCIACGREDAVVCCSPDVGQHECLNPRCVDCCHPQASQGAQP